VIYKPGPIWPDSHRDYADAVGFEGHIAHCKRLHADGKIFGVGHFRDSGGGMTMLSADVGIEEAEHFVREDPAVRSGLLTAEIHSWIGYSWNEDS